MYGSVGWPSQFEYDLGYFLKGWQWWSVGGKERSWNPGEYRLGRLAINRRHESHGRQRKVGGWLGQKQAKTLTLGQYLPVIHPDYLSVLLRPSQTSSHSRR